MLSPENVVSSVAIGVGLWLAGAIFIRATHKTLFAEPKNSSESATPAKQGVIFAALPPVSLVTMQSVKLFLGLSGHEFICSSSVIAITLLFLDAISISYTSVYLVDRSRLFLTAGSLLWAVGWSLLAAYLIA